MKYVFVNSESIVVNVIDGLLSDNEAKKILADYRVLFGATDFVMVAPNVPTWSGGTYDVASGTFAPPPDPIVEPIPDQPTEGITDGIAVFE